MNLSSWSLKKQVLVFTFITTLFVGPHLCIKGTNIVTHTYEFGAERLVHHQNPYVDPQGRGDWYKYSPFFAVLYAPLRNLGESAQALVWGVLNIFLFWLGVSLWFRVSNIQKGQGVLYWLGFLFCSMEVDGSIRYQQINASLVGVSLIGMHFYKQKSFFWAGFLLALASNIKVLPLLFLGLLCFPVRGAYLLGAFSGLLFSFSFPALFVGLSKNILFHQEWIKLLGRDVSGQGLLDIATILSRYQFPSPKETVLIPIAIISTVLMLLSRIKPSIHRWDLWISMGWLCLLLISPRTESPTFVFAGPCYLFLLTALLREQRAYVRQAYLAVWVVGIFLITLCMNDIWPRWVWSASSMRYANKTLGVLLLWTLASYLALRYLAQAGRVKNLLRLTIRNTERAFSTFLVFFCFFIK